jgi:hypothetical protein
VTAGCAAEQMKLAIAEDDKRRALEAEWGAIVYGPKGLEKRNESIQQIIDNLMKRKDAHGDGFAVLMFLEDPENAGKMQKVRALHSGQTCSAPPGHTDWHGCLGVSRAAAQVQPAQPGLCAHKSLAVPLG